MQKGDGGDNVSHGNGLQGIREEVQLSSPGNGSQTGRSRNPGPEHLQQIALGDHASIQSNTKRRAMHR